MEPRDGAPVGMAEIALEAGVAVSTVSRALSGAPGVSAQKRAQILEIARRTGYLAPVQPAARERRPGPARITAVIPESDRWVFGSMLAGLQEVFSPADVHLTVHQGSSGAERARIAGSGLFDTADLVVLVPLPRGVPAADIARFKDRIVVAGSVVPGVPSVGIDDVAVGQKAAHYLINVGYRNIAFAACADHEGTRGHASLKRGQGVSEALTQAGLDPSWTIVAPFGSDAGQFVAEELLQGSHLPEAVVASSDEMAAQMMTVFRRAGVRVPDDVAIIGVDGHPIAELMQLTTIAQPARQQGQEAARIALDLVGGGPIPEPLVLPTRLIVRESTRRPDST